MEKKPWFRKYRQSKRGKTNRFNLVQAFGRFAIVSNKQQIAGGIYRHKSVWGTHKNSNRPPIGYKPMKLANKIGKKRDYFRFIPTLSL